MSTYEDNLLAARFAALAPEPLAGDWDDVSKGQALGRAADDSGIPVAAGPRRRLLVVLAVVALVAVVSASAFAVRAFVIDKGIVGLPPVGATPSTPESGVLEMYYWVTTHSAEQELGVRRRAVDPAWCSASPRLPRATPHTRGSQAPAIRDRLGRRVRTRPAAARQHVPPTPSRSRYARVTGSSPSGGRAI